jgi:hypothetical protein
LVVYGHEGAAGEAQGLFDREDLFAAGAELAGFEVAEPAVGIAEAVGEVFLSIPDASRYVRTRRPRVTSVGLEDLPMTPLSSALRVLHAPLAWLARIGLPPISLSAYGPLAILRTEISDLGAAMTSPDELMRAVDEFRSTLDSIGSGGVSVAADLTLLDRLVRRYPEAARKSLELYDVAIRERSPDGRNDH